jgi:hypothetical protein
VSSKSRRLRAGAIPFASRYTYPKLEVLYALEEYGKFTFSSGEPVTMKSLFEVAAGLRNIKGEWLQ